MGEILENCYFKNISPSRREKLQGNALEWAERNRLYDTQLRLSWWAKNDIYRPVPLKRESNKLSPFISWEIISMLQPYYGLLISLRDAVQLKEEEKGIKDPLVPYFHEISPYFLLDKARAKRRRNWLLWGSCHELVGITWTSRPMQEWRSRAGLPAVPLTASNLHHNCLPVSVAVQLRLRTCPHRPEIAAFMP